MNYKELMIMTRLTDKKIVVIFFVALFLVFIMFYNFLFSDFNRLSLSHDVKFDKVGVLNISEKEIENEAEVYNEGKFLEYKCLFKDSCLNLIHVGTLKESVLPNILDMITIVNKPMPYPESPVSGMTFTIPFCVEAATIGVFCNVYLLPIADLRHVKMYVSGEIKAVEQKNNYEVNYKLYTNNLSFAFNEEKETNLRYAIGADGALTNADFTFIIDPKTNHFYIVITTKIWQPLEGKDL